MQIISCLFGQSFLRHYFESSFLESRTGSDFGKKMQRRRTRELTFARMRSAEHKQHMSQSTVSYSRLVEHSSTSVFFMHYFVLETDLFKNLYFLYFLF